MTNQAIRLRAYALRLDFDVGASLWTISAGDFTYKCLSFTTQESDHKFVGGPISGELCLHNITEEVYLADNKTARLHVMERWRYDADHVEIVGKCLEATPDEESECIIDCGVPITIYTSSTSLAGRSLRRGDWIRARGLLGLDDIQGEDHRHIL